MYDGYKRLKIYLAGKMSGLTYKEMNQWRTEIKRKLNNATDNTRCSLVIVNPVNYYNFEEQRHQSEDEIKEYDLKHVASSDVVIVNLDGLESSEGTKLELHDAKYHNKIPVIAFGDRNLYERLHPWHKSNITRVEENIDDVVNYIRDFYMI